MRLLVNMAGQQPVYKVAGWPWKFMSSLPQENRCGATRKPGAGSTTHRTRRPGSFRIFGNGTLIMAGHSKSRRAYLRETEQPIRAVEVVNSGEGHATGTCRFRGETRYYFDVEKRAVHSGSMRLTKQLEMKELDLNLLCASMFSNHGLTFILEDWRVRGRLALTKQGRGKALRSRIEATTAGPGAASRFRIRRRPWGSAKA
ncbi:MAG: hypothetical protein ACI9QL_002265 [Candidatus Omnitrophota bacterium]|jgi:hypothetical protein